MKIVLADHYDRWFVSDISISKEAAENIVSFLNSHKCSSDCDCYIDGKHYKVVEDDYVLAKHFFNL